MKLDEFTKAYLEAAFWRSYDQESDPIQGFYQIENIAPAAYAAAIEDCKKFQSEYSQFFTRDYCTNFGTSPEALAGHHFWLTRTRDGSGFWDGSWKKEAEKILTPAAKNFKELKLYIGDDDLVYGFGE